VVAIQSYSRQVDLPAPAVDWSSKRHGVTANGAVPRRERSATTRRPWLCHGKYKAVNANLGLLIAAAISLLSDQGPDELTAVLAFVMSDFAFPHALAAPYQADKLTCIYDRRAEAVRID